MAGKNQDGVLVQVRKAESSDLLEIGRCHIISFPGEFMSQMGICWLKSLYNEFIKHPRGISLVAVDNENNIIGFAFGGERKIRDTFLKNAVYKYCFLIFFKFLTCKIIRKKLIRHLAHIFRSKGHEGNSKDEESDQGLQGSLLSIGVSPRAQAKGVGTLLVQNFEQHAKNMGFNKMMLTVRKDNLKAIQFYKKNGWNEISEIETEKKFIKNL